ncbi:hypothetical protein DVR12_00270 [Chitinophaga silvatica]|uniref:Uncharacterized protein n=1 Tax=Chitinophaga silvatica TaxID=2282649 RepID=A0A3E1YFU1_9BACT|nr:hypothetical protein DVR12_00270 [Chitinophaga silvatica]
MQKNLHALTNSNLGKMSRANTGLLVFYLGKNSYLVYVYDKNKIPNEYRKETLKTHKSVKPGWYYGEDI